MKEVEKNFHVEDINLHHRIIIFSGLNSSGKDTILNAVGKELRAKRQSSVFFLTKYISKVTSVSKQQGGIYTYGITNVSERELRNNPKNEFWGVYCRFGKFIGFKYCELLDAINYNQNRTIIAVYSDVKSITS